MSEYVGGGEMAALIHLMDIEDAPLPIDKGPAELLALDAAIADNWNRIETLLPAALIAGGYHKHKGQWRKKRTFKP